jgi:hypothetical protein
MKRFSIVVLGGALLTAPPAWAQDYCIAFAYPFTSVLVGKNFYPLPRRGQCKQWLGWESIGQQLAASTGSACSDGTNLVLTITTGSNETIFHDIITIDLATAQGNDYPQGEQIGQAFMSYPSAVSGGLCPPTNDSMP